MSVDAICPCLKESTDLEVLIVEECCSPSIKGTITCDLNCSSSERNFNHTQVRTWECSRLTKNVCKILVLVGEV